VRSWRASAADTANRVLRIFDSEVVRRSYLEGLRDRAGLRHTASYTRGTLPAGATEYLTRDNPRLRALQAAYRGHPAAIPTQWDESYLRSELDLAYFRGDNAYLHQQSVARDVNYLLSAFYLRAVDRLHLFDVLSEDDLFGNYVIPLDDGRVISRDLCDSVAEITFLEECLSLSQTRDLEVLDIGAGYGRLAYRLVSGLPNIARVWCADAVAESTFLSEYYLGFRQVQERARVLELGAVDAALGSQSVHLATNVHSFSECGIATIRWWLDLLRAHAVQYLFVVPNDDRLLSTEPDHSRREFFPEILERGYRLVRRRPKYAESRVQANAAFPSDYYLFELTGS
jgi:hypothetical protein